MTVEGLEKLFDEHEGEFREFDRIDNKRSQRPDLHAFLLLDDLFPGSRCIVDGVSLGEIFLDTNVDELAEIATDELVIELTRCGVRLDADAGFLAIFV